jgi:hypothetical protein
MANEEQLSILRQGADVWIKWRKNNPDVEIDLTQSDLIGALYQRVFATISMVEEIVGNLRPEYSEQGLSIIYRLFEAMSKEYSDFAIVRNNPFYEVVRKSKSRLNGVNRVARQAKSMAMLFEKYTKKPKSYSAVVTRLKINGLLGELQNLATNTNEVSETPSSEISSLETTNSNKTIKSTWKSEIKPPINVNEPPNRQDGDSPDEVSFTAFYPKEGKVETWYTLLVYAHLASVLEDIYIDAGRFKDQLPTPKVTRYDSLTRIARGTKITIIPFCDGILFNPSDTYITWHEDYHCIVFRFRADRSLINDAAKGRITIMIGPLIVGTLNFAMLFSDKEDVPSMVQEEHSTMYREDRIFISYSHKDANLALAFKKVHEATGFDVLIDIDDLRSGQEWNPELMRMIDRADIFQLFWSTNSKESKYCKQEWKRALDRNTEGLIRPLYWKKPMPNPPKELSKYHFVYVDLHEWNL